MQLTGSRQRRDRAHRALHGKAARQAAPKSTARPTGFGASGANGGDITDGRGDSPSIVAPVISSRSGSILLIAAACSIPLFAVTGSSLVLAAGAFILLSKLASDMRSLFKRRQDLSLFLKGLPDALDNVTRAVRAGLPISDALRQLRKSKNPSIADAFSELSGDLELGVPLDDALARTASRWPVKELGYFIACVSIQRQTGGNLAEITANLAKLLRQREQVRLRIRALSSEARASCLILSLLPIVTASLLQLINPGYLDVLIYDFRGRICFAAGLFSMLSGIIIMYRMSDLEV